MQKALDTLKLMVQKVFHFYFSTKFFTASSTLGSPFYPCEISKNFSGRS